MFPRVLDSELQVFSGSGGRGVQRGVVTRLLVPRPVVIVVHDVHQVQVLVDLGHVVGGVDRVGSGADGSCQDQAVGLQGSLQLLHQKDKVAFVLGGTASFTCVLDSRRVNSLDGT